MDRQKVYVNVGTIGHIDHDRTTLAGVLIERLDALGCEVVSHDQVSTFVIQNREIEEISLISKYEKADTGKRSKKGKRLKDWQR